METSQIPPIVQFIVHLGVQSAIGGATIWILFMLFQQQLRNSREDSASDRKMFRDDLGRINDRYHEDLKAERDLRQEIGNKIIETQNVILSELKQMHITQGYMIQQTPRKGGGT